MSMDKKLTSAVYAAVEKAYDHRCDIEDAADEILEIIKADRQRRGEPVAYLRAENLVRLAQPHVAGCAASIQKEPADGFIPIFTAPHPAEPSRGELSALIKEAALHLTNWLDMGECDCDGPGHWCGRSQVERCRDRLLDAAPQPAESCASLMSDKLACGSENGDCDSQPAEPVGEVLGETCIDGGKCHHGCKERCFRRQCCEPFSDYSGPWKYAAETDSPQPAEPIVSDVEAIVRLLESREWAEHVATTPLGQRLETAVTVLVGADQQPSEPVKHHLKVSYDDKYDCLYVDCNDSDEPIDAEEDDKGILYRRAISDGRLIGITISNFMGQSRYGKGTP